MGLASRSENCCCCFSVKAGTLILLYLELFAVIISMGSVYNEIQSINNVVEFSDTNNNYQYYSRNTFILKDLSLFFIVGFTILAILVAGLFAIGKKKPSLLIPYLILRIILAIIVILIMVPLLFLEKKGLDMLDKPKTFTNAYRDLTGDDNNLIGKGLEYASNGLYVAIIVEIVLILLQIHYVKVVYACYKNIDEELNLNRGIMYTTTQIIPSTQPYIALHQQSSNTISSPEPVYQC